jgi:hypothetical protein
MARLYSRMPTNGSFLIAALSEIARLAVAVMPACLRFAAALTLGCAGRFKSPLRFNPLVPFA